MSLCNLNEILLDARKKKYGVIATNAFNFDAAEAIIKAAEEKKSPIILQICENLFKYFNFDRLMGAIISIAKDARVPVALHLDHGENLSIVMKSIKTNFTSVMFDGSTLPLDENIKIVKEITKVAHLKGVSVEGEVGRVVGLEGHSGDREVEIDKNYFTKVNEAIRFVNETKVDALAISVGTIHGIFKCKPDIDFKRIIKINDAVKIPLVLHGTSGLSDNDFRKAIQCGISKMNYFTDLQVAAIEKAKTLLNTNGSINYMELNYKVFIEIKEKIKEKMDLFNSTGRF